MIRIIRKKDMRGFQMKKIRFNVLLTFKDKNVAPKLYMDIEESKVYLCIFIFIYEKKK